MKLGVIMKVLQLIVAISFTLIMSACQSTAKHEYQVVEKRYFESDQALLLSLLNRPTPADQQLMLAFAGISNTTGQYVPTITPVSIVGPSGSSEDNRSVSPYQLMISNDNNAISMTGPN